MRGSLLVAAAVLSAPSLALSPDLYVNCNSGSDSSGDGSQGNPWLTPIKARNSIRAAQPLSAGVTVHVSGDCVPRDSTGAVNFSYAVLNLYGGQDSGSASAPITWAGEGARLLGGAPLSGWTGAGPVYTLSLPAAVTGFGLGALTPNGGLGTCINDQAELFYAPTAGEDLQAMILSRYPNIMANGSWDFINIHKVPNATSTFTCNDTHMAAWQGETDLWVHGFWSFDWADSYVPVGSVTPPSSGIDYTITSAAGTSPLYGYLPNARFMGVNSKVDVDAPGEYYFDKVANMLYFYPPVSGWTLGASLPEDRAAATAVPADNTAWLSMAQYVVAMGATPDDVISSEVNQMVRSGMDLLLNRPAPAEHLRAADGATVSYVAFTGFDIQLSRGTGIVASDASFCSFTGLDLSNHGHSGLSLAGNNNTVSNVIISATGCSASAVYGGNEQTLTPAGNVVQDSEFYNFARVVRTYCPAIGWGGVGNQYVRNYIHDAPHTGALGGGNNIYFAYNNLTNLCYEATDSGAFYTGRSWVRRGNVVQGNIFKDVRNLERMTLGWPSVQAVYLDDEMSGTSVLDNTFINCQTGIVVGGGRDTLVLNNTCIGGDLCVHYDNRGMNWQTYECAYNSTFTGPLVQDLFNVNYQQPPYATAYPPIVNTLAYHPCVPVNVTVAGNMWCNCTQGFIDATANQTASWFSYVMDNVQFQC